jgi:hypothetical protein
MRVLLSTYGSHGDVEPMPVRPPVTGAPDATGAWPTGGWR